MTGVAEDPGWAGFYAAMRGRGPRKPFDAAVQAAELRLGGPGRAADIGCGDGVETRLLLARGWHVLAVDSEPASAAFVQAELRADARAADALRLQTQTTSFSSMMLPERDLVWAGDDAREEGDPEMSFHDADAVRALLAGFDLVLFDEREWDGGAGGGPKHWHLFDVVAFKR